MNRNLIFRNIGRFALLMLLQVLVLNNVYLGGYITPFLYVLFIAMLPTNTNRIAMLLIAFASGLCFDIFSNMLGFHAFACTLTAFVRIMGAQRIIKRDDDEIETPSIRSGSYQHFIVYLLVLLLVYNLAYYILSVFSFRELPQILLSTVLSTVITALLAILYQTLLIHRPQAGGMNQKMH